MTEKERMIAGRMYDPGDPELVAGRMRAHTLCHKINHLSPELEIERDELIHQLFGTAGVNAWVEPNFQCDYGYNIHVGENFYANFDCTILDVCPVTIGRDCMLAPKVGIYTATHPLSAAARYSGRELGQPVTIGDRCWLGAGCIILPGVTLGDEVVVAAGAVVTKSWGSRLVLAGNPARPIKQLPDEQNGAAPEIPPAQE